MLWCHASFLLSYNLNKVVSAADDVLGEHRLWLHGDDVRGDLHHGRLQLPDDQVHRAHLQHLQAQGEHDPHLSVEGVELQLVRALERLRVDLLERDPVELALEDVDLLLSCYHGTIAFLINILELLICWDLNKVVSAANVVALPC